MQTDDVIAFSKIKTKDIMLSSLDRLKAKKMKRNYKRSLGMTLIQLNKDEQIKTSDLKREAEVIQTITGKYSVEGFVEQFQSKSYSLQCLEKLMSEYRRKQGYNSPDLRIKVEWTNKRYGRY